MIDIKLIQKESWWGRRVRVGNFITFWDQGVHNCLFRCPVEKAKTTPVWKWEKVINPYSVSWK